MKKKILYLSLIMFLIIGVSYLYKIGLLPQESYSTNQDASTQYTIIIPSDRFPETAAHVKAAIEHGETPVCTIDRKGAEENRKESLKGIPTKPNKDRDEFPMAMCAEGGAGADIAYVTPSDNRGAGSWVGNQLENYPDGTKVMIMVK
ncbi:MULTISPECIES: NucA/NucB deoxyribonuclease domain-containing protein [unclassified Paenibacillus]|uniref:NucA/NucB deoxyribonuclease domain-containing protein n=1 Tax=unclassified Paenibacillus TaxID=185978 RepID=UPI002785DD54|nr:MULTISPECIES: NucA/NucB deoxyribonuclease domain-containing protein [unclassified Paenibacillus]MDQ0896323.1 hypothetical protein [Paenibacillus sp. V4I7]MDQ0913751.1 hypothetical protein [Paenibacillus sp. V4I5]